MFKKISVASLFAPLLLLSSLGFAKPTNLQDFYSIQEAVNNGEEMTFVLDFTQCKSELLNETVRPMVASFKPSSVLNIKGKKVVASSYHFTLNHPRFKNIPVYQYANYQVLPSGRVKVSSSVLLASSSLLVAGPHDFECQLNTGAKVLVSR